MMGRTSPFLKGLQRYEPRQIKPWLLLLQVALLNRRFLHDNCRYVA